MQQPAGNNRVLPVPLTIPGRREFTREEIESSADYFYDHLYDALPLADMCDDDHIDPYDVCAVCVDKDDDYDDTYLSAAFRCSFGNKAYLFMHDQYMLLNYDPMTLDGGVDDEPKLIRKGMPSLYGTVFESYGIDCAFGLHHRNEAFIFYGDECARIAYARDSSDFKMLKGPTSIKGMFPFLEGTAFESQVDAAFESATDNEAYLFVGIEYAVINYEDHYVVSDKQTFDCLRETVFQSGIDAAFASHVTGEAFIFKDDSYALINFLDRCIIGDVKKILPDGCPSLSSVLPRKNCVFVDDFVIYSVDEPNDEAGPHSVAGLM